MSAYCHLAAWSWLVSHRTVPIPSARNADQASHSAGGLGWSLTDLVTAFDQLGCS